MGSKKFKVSQATLSLLAHMQVKEQLSMKSSFSLHSTPLVDEPLYIQGRIMTEQGTTTFAQTEHLILKNCLGQQLVLICTKVFLKLLLYRCCSGRLSISASIMECVFFICKIRLDPAKSHTKISQYTINICQPNDSPVTPVQPVSKLHPQCTCAITQISARRDERHTN